MTVSFKRKSMTNAAHAFCDCAACVSSAASASSHLSLTVDSLTVLSFFVMFVEGIIIRIRGVVRFIMDIITGSDTKPYTRACAA